MKVGRGGKGRGVLGQTVRLYIELTVFKFRA